MYMYNPIPINGANQACWFALFYKVNYGTVINLFLFIGIMVGAYYLSKYLLSKSPYRAPFHTGKVKERLYINQQSAMVIVEVQGVHYVLVNDKGRTVLIDRREDLSYPPEETLNPVPEFQNLLTKIIRKNEEKK